ncbi:hypothetical protein [Gluconobacter wancherniae]|uniref:Uncharacterized protein n=1 Tax=Gluconobacter wancherniae NBRC 103581 TaxID=656744 RepID=A0A511AWQ1_9PROT|nr:hypothetical protein [Gluconobacter wancherniae]MBF0852826.1 hypothetical protein [Gluconobacter wancherniae]MBS1061829.1 hypothetical protein [Gluconobacter wancherniae]MBS1087713.1 hypothetical protein [Gluconobacter wancherniae]MBS1093395.1 hypothetical protein [Gluconobacter wancherniae]GBD56459.1 hypothetical protein NBRC103581_01035 [Gluconobacter wancherniae NBRC 103581]
MTRFFRYALMASALLGGAAQAQTVSTPSTTSSPFGQVYSPGTTTAQQGAQAPSADQQQHGGEHFRARGKRSLPPGYQDAPSNDFQHGPDPDHLAGIQRDASTGANIGKFGSSYQNSNPTQSGQLGDSTGNGWVAPRGNGW